MSDEITDVRRPRAKVDLRMFNGSILDVTCPRIAILGTDGAIGKRTTVTILAVGRQDSDAADLTAPPGVEILAASSDHLIVETRERMSAGDEIRFEPGYSALLRSMTSPFVVKNPAPRQSTPMRTPRILSVV